MEKQRIASDILSCLGISIALQYIYTVLGIVLLIINLLILCYNFFVRLKERLKDHKLTDEEKNDTIKDVKEIAETGKDLVDAIKNIHESQGEDK